MTPGMSWKSWKVPMTDNLEFRFYDLEGQPVYATAQSLFLHTRACFFVVWNTKAEKNGLDRVHEYVRDLLDVVSDALLTFVLAVDCGESGCRRPLPHQTRSVSQRCALKHVVSSLTMKSTGGDKKPSKAAGA
eukprot:scaffold3026_cov221-Pinguiococcus_pyrenoidosus.AAC.12